MNIDFEYLVKNTPSYIYLIDREENIRYINKVAPHVDINSIVGISLSEIVVGENYEKISRAIHTVFETGQSLQVDAAINGERWKKQGFSFYFMPYKKEGKKIKYVLGFNIDNTLTIKERERAQNNENRFRKIIEGSPDDVMQLDENLNILYHNSIAKSKNIKTMVIGKNVFDFIGKKDHKIVKEKIEKALATGETQDYELEGKDPVNGIKWYRGRCSVYHQENQKKGILIHSYDITAKKLDLLKTKEFNERLEQLVEERTEELKNANAEVEILIKEMHHRVKNNLQIISSLLSLQSNYVDKKAQKLLKISRDRIHSMSLIHEMLYKNKKLSSINIQDYFYTLLDRMIATPFKERSIAYDVQITTQKKELEIEQLIPLGLLVNELITNSLKHAFQNINDPKIDLTILDSQTADTYNTKMIYKDNGVGLSTSSKKDSLGFELIETFIDQLDGECHLKEKKQGVHYEFLYNV